MEESLRKEIEEALLSRGEWLGRISLSDISGISPMNARKHLIDKEMEELQKSIGLSGEIYTPIGLNPKFQIVKGQRRFIVAKEWKIQTVPVIIRTYRDEEQELVDSFNENQLTTSLETLDREDAIRKLGKKYTQKQVGDYLGLSQTYIGKFLQVDNSPDPIRNELNNSGMPLRDQIMILPRAKEILAELGPEKAIEFIVKTKTVPTRDKETICKDAAAGATVDLEERKKMVEKKANPKDNYTQFNIRLKCSIDDKLNKISKKTGIDKAVMINEAIATYLKEKYPNE